MLRRKEDMQEAMFCAMRAEVMYERRNVVAGSNTVDEQEG